MAKNYSAIKPSFSFSRHKFLIALNIFAFSLLAMALLLFYLRFYQNHYYPNTFIDDLSISALTLEEAKEKIYEQKTFQEDFTQGTLELNYKDQSFSYPLEDINFQINLENQLKEILQEQKGPNPFRSLLVLVASHFHKTRFYSQLSFDPEKMLQILTDLQVKLEQVGETARASLKVSGRESSLEIFPGEESLSFSPEENLEIISSHFQKSLKNLKEADFQIELKLEEKARPLSPEALQEARDRAKKYLEKSLSFQYEYEKYRINDQELISFLSFPDGVNQQRWNENQLAEFIDTWAKTIDRPAINAQFEYDAKTLEVKEFQDAQDAVVLQKEDLRSLILAEMEKIEKQTEDEENVLKNDTEISSLPVSTQKAAVELADTNDLGIKEVIGFGESWYYHSIPARIYNVSLTAKTLNNLIIPPGEEFSFNQALGEVSTKTEYKSAYIIQGGQTILAPGGGVCQVSSTLFRALLGAGLKVTRRLPHSYRVSYYEIQNDPGFDATVYAGNIDLRFLNDTDHYLLLHFETDSNNFYMTVKIYGTSDGRTTEIVDYRKWGYRPAATPIYMPDPSLAPGQIKQIDWAATGIKAEFSNIVRDKNGQLMHKDYYYSSYQPWSAKYLVGQNP